MDLYKVGQHQMAEENVQRLIEVLDRVLTPCGIRISGDPYRVEKRNWTYRLIWDWLTFSGRSGRTTSHPHKTAGYLTVLVPEPTRTNIPTGIHWKFAASSNEPNARPFVPIEGWQLEGECDFLPDGPGIDGACLWPGYLQLVCWNLFAGLSRVWTFTTEARHSLYALGADAFVARQLVEAIASGELPCAGDADAEARETPEVWNAVIGPWELSRGGWLRSDFFGMNMELRLYCTPGGLDVDVRARVAVPSRNCAVEFRDIEESEVIRRPLETARLLCSVKEAICKTRVLAADVCAACAECSSCETGIGSRRILELNKEPRETRR